MAATIDINGVLYAFQLSAFVDGQTTCPSHDTPYEDHEHCFSEYPVSPYRSVHFTSTYVFRQPTKAVSTLYTYNEPTIMITTRGQRLLKTLVVARIDEIDK